MNYKTCGTCGKPLINVNNLRILRISLGPVFGAVLGSSIVSFVASWQGPAVVAEWWSTVSRSLSARELGILLSGVVGSVVSGTGALGLIYRYRELFGWCSCN